MYTILILGVGGPTPRSFVRAVKWHGDATATQFDFIGVDCNPLAYGLYDKALFSKTFLIPRADHPTYWETLNKIIRENNIDGAIVLPEVEVIEWAKNAATKLEKKIKLHLPDYNLALELVNKHKLHALLSDTDYIPRFAHLNPKQYDYNALKAAVGDVFWVRSTEGSSGLGSLKITGEDALHQWISINPGVSEFIATEYLPGRNMGCKMLYFNGKLLRTACGERVVYIMSKVAPSGVTGNSAFGRLLNEPNLVKISQDALEKIAAKVGALLHGIYTVDYKEAANGDAKITEVNIRHVAFTSSFAAGGANIPLDTLKALFLENPEDMPTIHYQFEEGLIFVRDVDGYPIVMKEADFLKIQ
ncbi:MAG: hypothetical protein ACOYKE_06020 [Ferruginibacter sp.]